MAIEQPPRYVVLVWFHDEWKVNLATDELVEAVNSQSKARQHNADLRPILIDTDLMLTGG